MRLLLPATLALVAAAMVVAPGTSAAPRQDPDAFTPIVPTVVAAPWPVKGSDGRVHVVYEVQLLNTTRLPWRVTRVAVRSATGRGRALASWVAHACATSCGHWPTAGTPDDWVPARAGCCT
jgi:hypothetical protein